MRVTVDDYTNSSATPQVTPHESQFSNRILASSMRSPVQHKSIISSSKSHISNAAKVSTAVGTLKQVSFNYRKPPLAKRECEPDTFDGKTID